MGCLFEFLFELVFEVILELVVGLYLKLMLMVVPRHTFNACTRKKVKTVVTVIAVLAMASLIIGLLLWASGQPFVQSVGRYMTFVPLSIMGVHLVLGIVVRIVSRVKRQD